MNKLFISLCYILLAFNSQAQVSEITTPRGTFHAEWNIVDKQNLVILIPGSGQVDRNGNAGGMRGNDLLYLSDSLSAKGISTLRTDKITSAESEVSNYDNLLYDEFVSLVNNWVDVAVDSGFQNVYVLGHSQGALSALLIGSQRDDIAGVISLCGAGRPIIQILKEQLAQQFAQDKMESISAAFDSVALGYNPKCPNAFLTSLFNEKAYPFLRSWNKYDPATVADSVTLPVLILNGETDIQVSILDGEILSAHAPNNTFHIIRGMGHMLREAPNQRMLALSFYGRADLPIVSELPARIAEFISRN